MENLDRRGDSESLEIAHRGILFVLGEWGIGGAERVTLVLASEFVKRGWRVGLAIFRLCDNSLLRRADPDIKILDLGGKGFSAESGNQFFAFATGHHLHYVVNGWCVPYAVTRFIWRALGPGDWKLVSLHHNVPNMNNCIAKARNPVMRKLMQIVTAINLHLVYGKSDAYVLLSESFKRIFVEFAKVSKPSKLHAIANPLTLPPVPPCPKENVLLYVGRLEETQKKISRVVDMWKMLHVQFPDWRLDIVGDGPDRKMLEVRASGVERITFYGFQNPAEFYARAKVLLMTSDFEGFPLVLAEAMAAGCVPVVLGSFPAVHDLVTSANGVVVKPPFEQSRFSEALVGLLQYPERLNTLADVCARAGSRFTVESVVDRWESLLRGL